MVEGDIVRDRGYYNIEILQDLIKYLRNNPELRFHQALQNLGINEREQGDRFYEESEDTYKKMLQERRHQQQK